MLHYNLSDAIAFIISIDTREPGKAPATHVWGECVSIENDDYDSFKDVILHYEKPDKVEHFINFVTNCSLEDLNTLYNQMERQFPRIDLQEYRALDLLLREEKVNIQIAGINYICKLYLMEVFLKNNALTNKANLQITKYIQYAQNLVEKNPADYIFGNGIMDYNKELYDYIKNEETSQNLFNKYFAGWLCDAQIDLQKSAKALYQQQQMQSSENLLSQSQNLSSKSQQQMQSSESLLSQSQNLLSQSQNLSSKSQQHITTIKTEQFTQPLVQQSELEQAKPKTGTAQSFTFIKNLMETFYKWLCEKFSYIAKYFNRNDNNPNRQL